MNLAVLDKHITIRGIRNFSMLRVNQEVETSCLMLASPLTYVVRPWSVHCEYALEKLRWIFNYRHFRDK